MAVEVSEAVLEDTPRRRKVGHRWFTETTLDWFRLGEEIAETPVEGEYEQPPRKFPWALQLSAITIGFAVGLLAAWLVW